MASTTAPPAPVSPVSSTTTTTSQQSGWSDVVLPVSNGGSGHVMDMLRHRRAQQQQDRAVPRGDQSYHGDSSDDEDVSQSDESWTTANEDPASYESTSESSVIHLSSQGRMLTSPPLKDVQEIQQQPRRTLVHCRSSSSNFDDIAGDLDAFELRSHLSARSLVSGSSNADSTLGGNKCTTSMLWNQEALTWDLDVEDEDDDEDNDEDDVAAAQPDPGNSSKPGMTIAVTYDDELIMSPLPSPGPSCDGSTPLITPRTESIFAITEATMQLHRENAHRHNTQLAGWIAGAQAVPATPRQPINVVSDKHGDDVDDDDAEDDDDDDDCISGVSLEKEELRASRAAWAYDMYTMSPTVLAATAYRSTDDDTGDLGTDQ